MSLGPSGQAVRFKPSASGRRFALRGEPTLSPPDRATSPEGTMIRPPEETSMLIRAVSCALVLMLGACTADGSGEASSGTVDVQVRPLEDVLDSPIVITADPSGTSATVSLTTTIPLACAAIYGEDDDFGMVATDADMAGAAIIDHAPVLLGLQPETDYQYVMQGSDAAGNLYRSEVLTFTTPEATELATPGPDVAVDGTVVDVSSEFSASFGAVNAIDGDASTEWSSDGDGDDAALTIELAEITDIAGFGVRSRSMGDGTSIVERYRVVVDDGTVLGPFDADPDGLAVVEVTTSGQRFRVEAVATTGGNTGFVAIEIYAAD
jgi:hypothetical protein